MELGSPERMRFSEVTTALIADVDAVARRVHEYRPLPRAVVRRIEEDLLGERVYSSNAIEGSTLDLRETVMILKSGVLGARKRREALEARNLGNAARRLMEWRDAGTDSHTSEHLREIHGLILKEIDDSAAGRFRGPGVVLFGAKHQPPDDSRVPSLVEEMFSILRRTQDAHPIRRAAWTHWALARIHPFVDGNGRTARLWQDLILYEGNLTCAVIRPEDRREYLEALGAADEGEFDPFVSLVAQSLSRAFDKYLVELRRLDEDERFIKELAGEADARLTQVRELSYRRWTRKMEALRTEFEHYAGRISLSSSELQVQVRPYQIVDQTRWENIRSGLGAEQTWFFTMDFRAVERRRTRRYCFFFGKHFWRLGLDDDRDRSEQRVCLLISEDDGTGKGARLDDIPDCPISMREVFIVDEQFVVRRTHLETGNEEYDRNVPAKDIAQTFIKEVVLHRLS
jgi:Fic family protein